jgi:hypothetical protein
LELGGGEERTFSMERIGGFDGIRLEGGSRLIYIGGINLQQGSRFILSWFHTKQFLNHVKNCGIRTRKVIEGQRDLS